jgi:hypothetical protein
VPTMKFGKYQGMDYSEVPTDYIQWLMDDTKKKLAEYERELDLRKNKAEDSWMNQIVEKGYAALRVLDAQSVNHTKLDTAYKALKAAISEAAEPKGN